MWIAPVVSPISQNTSMASKTLWIPPGMWIEAERGTVISGKSDGSTVVTHEYDLSEIPVFVKAGAIIPGIPVRHGDTVGVARRQYRTLVLTVYPGAAAGRTEIYEDDGETTAYVSGKFTKVSVNYTVSDTEFDLFISPPTGGYPEFPKTRDYIIKIVNSMPIITATVNGIPITYSRMERPNTWRYDGQALTTIITTDSFATSSFVEISATTLATNSANLSGMRGKLRHAILSKQNLDEANDTPGSFSVTDG